MAAAAAAGRQQQQQQQPSPPADPRRPDAAAADYPLEPLSFAMVGSDLYYFDERNGWQPAA